MKRTSWQPTLRFGHRGLSVNLRFAAESRTHRCIIYLFGCLAFHSQKRERFFFFIERVIFVNFWRNFESKEHGNSLLRFSYFTFVSMVLARMALKKSSSTLFSCNFTIRDKMFETPTLFSKGRKFTSLPHKSQVAVLVLPITGGRHHVSEECPVKRWVLFT